MNMHTMTDQNKSMQGLDEDERGSLGQQSKSEDSIYLEIKESTGILLKCDQCNYLTSRERNLKRHIKVMHENILDHKCNQCYYACAERSNLKRHIKWVHNKGDRNIKCDKCSYSAYQKEHLNRHMKRVHEKIKNYCRGTEKRH